MKNSTLLLAVLAAFVLGGIVGRVFTAGVAAVPRGLNTSTERNEGLKNAPGRYQLAATPAGLFVMDTATGTVKVIGTGGRVGTWDAGYADLAARGTGR